MVYSDLSYSLADQAEILLHAVQKGQNRRTKTRVIQSTGVQIHTQKNT